MLLIVADTIPSMQHMSRIGATSIFLSLISMNYRVVAYLNKPFKASLAFLKSPHKSSAANPSSPAAWEPTLGSKVSW